MPELSIIVPVYKVEPYLPKCIDSILAQTFTDFELILIDDGSPDRCGEICDEYAKKDSRIVVIHQKNQGVSAARNAGLDAAQGEYIGFVDADDWLEPEMYKSLMDRLLETGCDLVGCTYYHDNTAPTQRAEDELRFPDSRALLFDLYTKPSKMSGSCCIKLFRRSVIGSVRFIVGMTAWEDLVFLQNCYLHDPVSAVRLAKPLYHYRSNAESATNNTLNIRYGRQDFQRYVFSVLEQTDQAYANKALTYFLDSSIQLISQYRKSSEQNLMRKRVRQVKRHIFYWVLRGTLQRRLSSQERNRFLMDGVIKA